VSAPAVSYRIRRATTDDLELQLSHNRRVGGGGACRRRSWKNSSRISKWPKAPRAASWAPSRCKSRGGWKNSLRNFRRFRLERHVAPAALATAGNDGAQPRFVPAVDGGDRALLEKGRRLFQRPGPAAGGLRPGARPLAGVAAQRGRADPDLLEAQFNLFREAERAKREKLLQRAAAIKWLEQKVSPGQ
jgi:hypothetical protein